MGETNKAHINGNGHADSCRLITDRKSIHYVFVSQFDDLTIIGG